MEMKKLILILIPLVLISCKTSGKSAGLKQEDAERAQWYAEYKKSSALCAQLRNTITEEERKSIYEDCHLKTPIAKDTESIFFCEYVSDYFYICCDTKKHHAENPRLVAGFKDFHETSRSVKFGHPVNPYGEPSAPYFASDRLGGDLMFVEKLSVAFDDGSEFQFSYEEISKIKRAYALVSNRLR